MSYAMKDRTERRRRADVSKDALSDLVGMRVQLMKALSFVHHGALLVYRLRTDYIESEAKRMFGGQFTQDRNWLSEEVEPLFVPGTLSPEVIGDLLIHFGWVMPVDSDWGGYTRRFILSEAGEKALEGAKVWWSSLRWSQKAWLYMTE